MSPEPTDYIARLPLTQAEKAKLYVLAKEHSASIESFIAKLVRDALPKSEIA